MKVKELIALLRKQNQNATVYVRDHDQSPGEFNGTVKSVWEFSDAEKSDAEDAGHEVMTVEIVYLQL